MKFTKEVISALEILKQNAESEFELHRISVLENDLIKPPEPEIIDDFRQKFNETNYYATDNKKHFRSASALHRDVYSYYHGEIPEGYVIHHIDRNKANNKIENLQLMTVEEHALLHSNDRIGGHILKVFTCINCGNTFVAYGTGTNLYCSKVCQKAYRQKGSQYQTERTCVVCGKKFKARKDKPTKTCSQACASKLRMQKRKPVPQTVQRICIVCGKTFECNKFKSTLTCSSKCAHVLSWQKRFDRNHPDFPNPDQLNLF